MPLVWTSGPPNLVTTIRARLVGLEAEIRAMLQEAGVGADLSMRKIIVESTTPTGLSRAGGDRSGPRDAGLGIAGRVESDDMRSSVRYRVTDQGADIVLKYGWLTDKELYFMYQEYGTSTIEGMNALFTTQQITVLEVALNLARIARGA